MREIALPLTVFLVVHTLNYKFHTTHIPRLPRQQPLWDVIHRRFNDRYCHYDKYYDYVLPMFFLPLLWASSTQRYEFFADYLSIWLPIMSIRSITNMVTVLPSSRPGCDKRHLILGYCNDKIFSGHTVTVFLCALMLIKHGIVTDGAAKCTVLLGSVLFGFFIVLVRDHYTVDVLLSFVITWLAAGGNLSF